MVRKRFVKISGIGTYLPKNRQTAEATAQKLGCSVDWIRTKTGVENRHFVSEGETVSQMGAEAAKRALLDANHDPEEMQLIIAAGGIPQQPLPCTAILIQKELGMARSGIPCWDINSTCMSFLNAIENVSYMIAAGAYSRVLIVSPDIASVGINWEHKESASLFGDGCGAIVLEKTPDNEDCHIIASQFCSYGIGSDICEIVGGGSRLPGYDHNPENHHLYLFKMNGPKLFRFVIKHLPDMINDFLTNQGVSLDEIDYVVPHQASQMAMELLRKKLDLDHSRFINILADTGNCVAASLPLALNHTLRERGLRRGNKVLFLGVSAGISLGLMLMQF